MAKKLVKRAVTQEDLDLNPELVEEGVEVGAIMKLPPLPEKDELDEEDDDTDESEEDEKSSDGSIKKVTFSIRNPNVAGGHSTRVFEESSHGADFLKTADEFEASNTWKKPVNMNDPVEVKACQDFNVNIKHPVMSRTNE